MDLEKEISEIKARNVRVENDKAWESSWFRRLVITLITYFIASFWLAMIKVENFWLNAFVPTGGYLLSTLTIPVIKSWWVKKIR